jgi:hypothetical protein
VPGFAAKKSKEVPESWRMDDSKSFSRRSPSSSFSIIPAHERHAGALLQQFFSKIEDMELNAPKVRKRQLVDENDVH